MQEEHHVKIRAEIGVMILQTKKCQRLTAKEEAGEGCDRDSSSQHSEGINLAVS